MEDVNTRQGFSFLNLKYSPLEFNSTTIYSPPFDNLNMEYKSDEFFETAWIYFIRGVFVTVVIVVAFKLPIVNSVDVRKICLLTFVSQKASEMAYHDNVKNF